VKKEYRVAGRAHILQEGEQHKFKLVNSDFSMKSGVGEAFDEKRLNIGCILRGQFT